MSDEKVWRGFARWSDDFLARFGKTGWLFGAPQLLINKPKRNRWMISCWNAEVTEVVLLPAADYDALKTRVAELEAILSDANSRDMVVLRARIAELEAKLAKCKQV